MAVDEAARLAALRRYRILDTEPERQFDDLTALASYICEAPIALLTLIDSDRQWFKSKVGISLQETSRSIAFCDHTIRQDDLMIVPDALEDARFATNPTVTSEPYIRFYAGASLVTPDGHALGSLCVVDKVPRTLTPQQEDALRALRNQVIAQLELRRNLDELEQALRARDEAEAGQLTLIRALQTSAAKMQKMAALLPLCQACEFSMEIPADPSQISKVSDGVMQMLKGKGLVGDDDFNIDLALQEALANAIRHGAKGDANKQIQCIVTVDDNQEILIVVRDPGQGFDPAKVPNPMDEKNLFKPSGRGVYLINQLMDEVRYEDEGREVRMKKRVGPTEPAKP